MGLGSLEPTPVYPNYSYTAAVGAEKTFALFGIWVMVAQEQTRSDILHLGSSFCWFSTGLCLTCTGRRILGEPPQNGGSVTISLPPRSENPRSMTNRVLPSYLHFELRANVTDLDPKEIHEFNTDQQ